MFAVEQSRCLDLEAEISKLQNENQKDVNDEMIRGFNKLEVEYLNLQLKYQHLQENFENNKSQTSQDVPEFDTYFRIKNLETQLQEKDDVIRNLKAQVSKINDRSCETYNAKDVTALIEQNECVRVELEKVKQHYKELYDSIKITHAHSREQTSTMLNKMRRLKALVEKQSVFVSLADSVNKKSVETYEYCREARVAKPLDNALYYACQYTKLSRELLEYVIGTCPKSFNKRDYKAPSTSVTRKKVNSSNRGSKPRCNTKNIRNLPAKSVNQKTIKVHPMTNKSV
ncbi:hypothetical protein Tco_0472381 [Tanacetum coccineum]